MPPLVTAFVLLAVGAVSIVVAVALILPSVSEMAEMYLPLPPTDETSRASMALATAFSDGYLSSDADELARMLVTLLATASLLGSRKLNSSPLPSTNLVMSLDAICPVPVYDAVPNALEITRALSLLR